MALRNLHRITCRLLPGACSCDTSETIGDFDMKKYNELNSTTIDGDDTSILLCSEIKMPTRRIKAKKQSAKVDASVAKDLAEAPVSVKEPSLLQLWYRSAFLVLVVYQIIYVASILIVLGLLYSETIGMDIFGENNEKLLTQTYHSVSSFPLLSWLCQDGSPYKQLADTLIVAWLMTNYTLKIRCLLTFVLAVPVFFLAL